MDDMDVEILKAIYEKSHNSLIAPLFLMEKFCVSDEEIGDRLEIMDEEGYLKVAKGAYTPWHEPLKWHKLCRYCR